MAQVDKREHADIEQLTDALLSAVEQGVEPRGDNDGPSELDKALAAFQHRAIEFVRRYNRLQIDLETTTLTDPVLFVANHGFGGIFDLNVLAAGAALEDLQLDRPVTFLTHQIAWTLGVGPLIEHLGARPASQDSARQAFADGHHVVVFPGGDLDAFKSWSDRNEVIFGGRSGFARLALEQRVPVVPIVTAGAGESLFVVTDGERLARFLRADKLLRLKALPVSVSLPWGINVGGVGLLPYLPLPTKLHTRVLAGIEAQPGEDADAYAERIHTTMQDALTEMTSHRRPLLG
jgi:1-acyl-sn-glycerol-3-phosphate acyltransferase